MSGQPTVFEDAVSKSVPSQYIKSISDLEKGAEFLKALGDFVVDFPSDVKSQARDVSKGILDLLKKVKGTEKDSITGISDLGIFLDSLFHKYMDSKMSTNEAATICSVAEVVLTKMNEQMSSGLGKAINSVMSKGKIRSKCGVCGFTIPCYPGRYPKTCPECGASINSLSSVPVDERVSVTLSMEEWEPLIRDCVASEVLPPSKAGYACVLVKKYLKAAEGDLGKAMEAAKIAKDGISFDFLKKLGSRDQGNKEEQNVPSVSAISEGKVSASLIKILNKGRTIRSNKEDVDFLRGEKSLPKGTMAFKKGEDWFIAVRDVAPASAGEVVKLSEGITMPVDEQVLFDSAVIEVFHLLSNSHINEANDEKLIEKLTESCKRFGVNFRGKELADQLFGNPNIPAIIESVLIYKFGDANKETLTENIKKYAAKLGSAVDEFSKLDDATICAIGPLLVDFDKITGNKVCEELYDRFVRLYPEFYSSLNVTKAKNLSLCEKDHGEISAFIVEMYDRSLSPLDIYEKATPEYYEDLATKVLSEEILSNLRLEVVKRVDLHKNIRRLLSENLDFNKAVLAFSSCLSRVVKESDLRRIPSLNVFRSLTYEKMGNLFEGKKVSAVNFLKGVFLIEEDRK